MSGKYLHVQDLLSTQEIFRPNPAGWADESFAVHPVLFFPHRSIRHDIRSQKVPQRRRRCRNRRRNCRLPDDFAGADRADLHLSDESAALAGSIGVLPSASLGPGPGLYEPIHGAAPDIAGKGIANPTGAILTVALMLEHAFKRPQIARAVESAAIAALRELRTPDVGGHATTDQVTEAVLRHLSWSRWSTDTEEETVGADWGV